MDFDLSDMELKGYHLTWERGRGGQHWIQMRLDRRLMSSSWSNLFPGAMLHNMEESLSDHYPILLELESAWPGEEEVSSDLRMPSSKILCVYN